MEMLKNEPILGIHTEMEKQWIMSGFLSAPCDIEMEKKKHLDE